MSSWDGCTMNCRDDLGLQLQLQGLVQGIGFRPELVRRATQLGLSGWIANTSEGVVLEAQGPRLALEQLVQQLINNPPPLSRIRALKQTWKPLGSRYRGFVIGDAQQEGHYSAQISPDLAICSDCERELRDPSSRRFHYPLTSCTQCGPRYSVLERLPFERCNTSYGVYPLCSRCAKEYGDPKDRRFHAQTMSCPACGPSWFWNGTAEDSRTVISRASEALRQGQIVALKGVGGFQLLADPQNPAVIRRLRERKGRPDKPLALLSTAEWLPELCAVSAAEAELFNSNAAPIVLLRRRLEAAVADGVAGESPWLGVMRPASGLQLLVLEQFGRPFIATSANRSGEPICRDRLLDNTVLLELADAVVDHGIAIVNRIDDSVEREAAGSSLILRLGRGLAPLALPSSSHALDSLAMGAQVKGALAIGQRSQLLLSPDLGDSSSCAGLEHLENTMAKWCELHQLKPARVVCDQHPGYSSSQSARAIAIRHGAELLPVQHHHAHLLAVMAEHQLSGDIHGVVWDGSGDGGDGSLWGGELLQASRQDSARLVHLQPFHLPGGERSMREPRRVALGLLREAYGSSWRQRLLRLPENSWAHGWPSDELDLVEQGLAQRINTVSCSSVGRLFDGVAALLNVEQICSYEAQAAIKLEGLAELAAGPPRSYRLPLAGASPLRWDWRVLIEEMLMDLEQGRDKAGIAFSFHQSLANAVANAAEQLGCKRMVLAGGCFQNRLLLELCVKGLRSIQVEPLWSNTLPSNDAAIPIGQLLALP